MPMSVSMTSLPVTNLLREPVSTIFTASGTLNHSLPVSIAAAMSVEPTPVDTQPSAP